MTDLRRAAAWYARHGLHIFPLRARSKFPIWGSRGYLDAATDAGVWTYAGDSGIGVNAIASGIVIVDVDDPDAVDDLPGPLPHTWTVLTARGSQHHYAVPQGHVPIWSGIRGRVDVRWRGYGILPPSIHPSGHVYTWEASSRPDEIPPAVAPTWLVGRERARTEPTYAEGDGEACDSLLGAAFAARGWLGYPLGSGRWSVRCPWTGEHTARSGRSSTILWAPTRGGLRVGRFWCSHGHCGHHRSMRDVLEALGTDALIQAVMAGYERELAAEGVRS